MNVNTAEKMVASAGRIVTIARADSWIGSKDACFRAGADASEMWACSYHNPVVGAVYEPTTFYRTLSELVEDQIARASTV